VLGLTIRLYSSTSHSTHPERRRAHPLSDDPYTGPSIKTTQEAEYVLSSDARNCVQLPFPTGNPEPVGCLGVSCPSVQDLLGKKKQVAVSKQGSKGGLRVGQLSGKMKQERKEKKR